ncbi:MAG: sulfotransferase family 2 domain-containing protein [Thermoleophilia bacterium]|nr:sulfotransferase family 2 domain-containing protein [Thermoleophilia bacterium]
MLELESTHVPKTAGISFLSVLRHWYGEPHVGVQTRVHGSAVSFRTTVMHGHFPAGTYRARQRVVWLRDPAWRLISHYHYLRYQQPPGSPANDEYEIHCRLWSGSMELDEFVRAPELQRSQAAWLGDLSLDDFDFVGIQENFDRELGRLATVLDKPAISVDGGENRTVAPQYAAFKRDLDPALLDEIRALHPECCELYAEAKRRADAWWAERDRIAAA